MVKNAVVCSNNPGKELKFFLLIEITENGKLFQLKTSIKRKNRCFRVIINFMGCLKLAHIKENEPVLRCVWKSSKHSKQDVNWYDYGFRFYFLDLEWSKIIEWESKNRYNHFLTKSVATTFSMELAWLWIVL